MKPSHEHFRRLAALEPIGELDPEEQRLLAEHLKRCSECRRAVREYRQILLGGLLPYADAPEEELPREKLSGVRPVQPALATPSQPRPATRPPLSEQGETDVHGRFSATRKERSWGRRAMLPVPAAAAALILGAAVWLGVDNLRWQGAYSDLVRSSVPRPAMRTSEPPVDRWLVEPSSSDGLKPVVEAQRREIARLRERLRKESNELQEALQVQSAREAERALLQGRVEALEQQVLERRRDLIVYRERVEGLNGALDSREQQIRGLRAERGRAEIELDAARRETRQLEGLLGAPRLKVIEVFPVAGLSQNRRARARIIQSPGYRPLLYAFNLDGSLEPDSNLQVLGLSRFRPPEEVTSGLRSADWARELGRLDLDDPEQHRWKLQAEGVDEFQYLVIVRKGAFSPQADQVLLYGKIDRN